MTRFLAFDLGAESGRGVIGTLAGDRLHLEEIHRFPNGPVQVHDSLHWDVLRLWSEIKEGLGRAAKAYGHDLTSVGLDAWGVDFALLGGDDTLLGNPYHYRDPRTQGMMEAAFQVVSRAEIYEQTGIQFMPINSLYQLLAMARAGSPALAAARTFVHIPDLFNFWLTGFKTNELTIATTSQCYNPRTGDWAWDMLDRLGIPTRMFGPIVPPGTVLGPLHAALCQETGGGPVPVIASASHDTAAAVAAVPATGSDYIYLSSGTWSLMGVELAQPLITPQSLACDVTNEGGVSGTFRFLKNIMGLWLVQECRREWARAGRNYGYDDLAQLAAKAPGDPAGGTIGPLISLADNRFLPSGQMSSRIQAYCAETGQPVPQTVGEIVRCALDSLALEYRWVAERLQELVGRPLPTLHIFGGGSRNKLLNQLAADATGRVVVAGPVEATAIGGLLVQGMALGHLSSLAEARALVRRSFALETYEPRGTAAWDEAYARYLELRSR